MGTTETRKSQTGYAGIRAARPKPDHLAGFSIFSLCPASQASSCARDSLETSIKRRPAWPDSSIQATWTFGSSAEAAPGKLKDTVETPVSYTHLTLPTSDL